MERVLINGRDARSHSIAWKILQTTKSEIELVFPAVNAGTAYLGVDLNIDPNDFERQIRWSKDNQVGLAFISSENQLNLGAVDQFKEAGILVFGPTQNIARLESSKIEGVRFNRDHGIPQPGFRSYTRPVDALAGVNSIDWPMVVKGDGLAGGKAVFVVGTDKQLARDRIRELVAGGYSRSGETGVVIQEKINGFEVSAQIITDGESIIYLPESQDHKKRFDDDYEGDNPNTGGKGAYAPVPQITPELRNCIQKSILEKAVQGMREEGHFFRGALYAGLMVTEDGPKVLEWNVRLGDPETQALMMLCQGDLLATMKACAAGRLNPNTLSFKEGFGVAVVLEALQSNRFVDIGRNIRGADENFGADVQVFHSGTVLDGDKVVTTGLGRILTVAAFGETLSRAISRAYSPLRQGSVSLPVQHYRDCIGQFGLIKRIKEGAYQ
ncbi:phosphoribosylamine--glycine ligase [Candidatus Daviesbacteria bacterium RIFCSPHIGHO2_02_FULL_41_14]|uniref:phosphoribosylamine--glycine ligase n=1 Tax=Candidatus Daviesbacteria bacterium RIFCSPLOWO2_01_FULL_40_24 TaxID=1797787 RepID=A0A1F5MJU2_9BACT|nr:MAG: phosphoribosylamine--glycine ligase [Candidatus Daviesbacteria bacterium RIFCSPHIGHO2_01_FULL_41_45]OGE35398.1 MAG: phosphoribosylamine--glycine ligase [Candidatus Daviesbacteria bacterium RIFCSPHIGHO2_02_FULL_41_14]OGE65641.1 MAG: phosphoribosylamine--glycine ligase [Candidatus Daviesbacteria bacterium RIFCSPLOWO2_01_FULL_40_24]